MRSAAWGQQIARFALETTEQIRDFKIILATGTSHVDRRIQAAFAVLHDIPIIV